MCNQTCMACCLASRAFSSFLCCQSFSSLLSETELESFRRRSSSCRLASNSCLTDCRSVNVSDCSPDIINCWLVEIVWQSCCRRTSSRYHRWIWTAALCRWRMLFTLSPAARDDTSFCQTHHYRTGLTGSYANLYLAPDSQHLTTQFFTVQMPFLPPNRQQLPINIYIYQRKVCHWTALSFC